MLFFATYVFTHFFYSCILASKLMQSMKTSMHIMLVILDYCPYAVQHGLTLHYNVFSIINDDVIKPDSILSLIKERKKIIRS